MSKVVYNGNNKNFEIPKKKLKLKAEVKIVIFGLFSLLFIMGLAFSVSKLYDTETDMKIINYNEKGSIFYQVYLKENTQYEDPFLNSGMQYVTSLIDEVRIKYNYELHANDKIHFDYEYKVTANVTITNQNEPDKILFTKSEEIETGSEEYNEKDLNINKDININYDKYNAIVTDYKNTYGVAVDSQLTVTMEIITKGSNEEINKGLESNNKLTVVIPLSEQTIGITTPDSNIDDSSYLTDYEDREVMNMGMLILAISFGILSILTVGILVIKIYIRYFKKDIYNATIRKYLREYDRLIVTSSQPDLNESVFNNKIRVMSIEELIDAHDTTGSPIIYYEVVPNEKSYFIIIDNLTLYKLTISKAYLEENKK